MSGWVKMHRVFAKWEWYDQANCVSVFIDLLIHANFEAGKYRGVNIPRGALTTSPDKIALRTGLTRQQVRTVLGKLTSTNEITTKTTNLFTMISITNWDKFQVEDEVSTSKITSKITNKQPTDNQPITTSKNLRIKEGKNNTVNGFFESGEKQDIEEVSEKEIIARILTAINAVCLTNYRPNKQNCGHINARLTEGYKYEDFLSVIKHKHKEWSKSAKMAQFLRPRTLFCTNFDDYLQAAKNSDKPILDPLEELAFQVLGNSIYTDGRGA